MDEILKTDRLVLILGRDGSTDATSIGGDPPLRASFPPPPRPKHSEKPKITRSTRWRCGQ